MGNGHASGPAGYGPLGNNFRSIENVNETTITNLADEFLNTDFTSRIKNDGTVGAPTGIHNKVQLY